MLQMVQMFAPSRNRVPHIYCGTTMAPITCFVVLLWCASILPTILGQQEERTVKKTINIDMTSGTESFTDDENFRDIFELTEENFEELVLEMEDPWIVIFTDGMIKKEWKTLAVSLRGIVWFGMIHRLQQEDLLDEIEFDARKNPAARVYPYGGARQKAKWTDIQQPKEAKDIAVNSLPDITTEMDPQLLENFLFDSYLTNPTSFPAVFITEKEISPLFKSIALHYKRYFNFGVVRNPNARDLANLKYNLGIPGLLILVSEDYSALNREEDKDESEERDYSFQSIGYTVEKQGEMNYPNLVKFLYSINIQYRRSLPGNNMAEEEDVLRMEDVMEIEGQRFDVRYMEDLRNIKGLEKVKLKNVEAEKLVKQNRAKSEL